MTHTNGSAGTHAFDARLHRRLTWEDATTRLLEASQIAPEEWPTSRAATKDAALWTFYKPFTGIDVLRTAIGVLMPAQAAVTLLSPPCVISQQTHCGLAAIGDC